MKDVKIEISQAENGYVVTKRWKEEKSGKGNIGMCDYKEETIIMDELPGELESMFSKGPKTFDEADKQARNRFSSDVQKKAADEEDDEIEE